MIKPFLLHHEMHMAWAITVPLQQRQELPDRSIVRDRIRHRDNGLEPENALGIARHDSPLIRRLASLILHIVLAAAVRLPDIDFDVLDGLALRVFDGAEYEAGLAGRVVGDLGSVRLGRGIVRVEGAEHCSFGAGRGFGMVDAVDEEGEAEDVGEKDEFLFDFALAYVFEGSLDAVLLFWKDILV